MTQIPALSVEDAIREEAAAYRAAEAIKSLADMAARDAHNIARAAFLKQHDYEGAVAAHRAAEIARVAAQDALPAHEWEGRKVFYVQKRIERWTRREIGEDRYEGIVETVRSTTTFPANKAYGLPAIGGVIVRMLKKDGSPGQKFENFTDWGGKNKWSLASTEPQDSE